MKNVDDIDTTVTQALFTATQKVKTQRGDTEMWLKEFSSFLQDELTFDPICSQNFSDIKDFDFLKEQIEKGFRSITEQMSRISLDKLKESRLKPDEILIDQLCNCCWVTCPFCVLSGVCTNTMKDHSPYDHSTPFHRFERMNGKHRAHTGEFSITFCTGMVPNISRLVFKHYKIAGLPYANWRIPPNGPKLAFWKWFVCRFQHELEEYYKIKFQGRGAVQWKTISRYEANKSLDEMCN